MKHRRPKNKAIFLDKDGTLIIDVPNNIKPELIKLSPDCLRGLKDFQAQGYLLVIISNQAGVALGYFNEKDLKPVAQRLEDILAIHNIKLDGFYYCPHHPDGQVSGYDITCTCRKPSPGLLQNAAEELDIDLKASWMIGDILNDVEAGNRAGCHTVLIDNGNETEWLEGPYRSPHKTAGSINDAAAYILTKANNEQQLARV